MLLTIVGENDLRPCLNATAGIFPFGTVVKKAVGQKFSMMLPTAVTDVAYGVVCDMQGIAVGAVGNMQIRGLGRVLVGAAGATAGARVSADATGAVVNSAGTNVILGTAMETGVAGQIIEVELAGPNGAVM
jgi:hypothetical protein